MNREIDYCWLSHQTQKIDHPHDIHQLCLSLMVFQNFLLVYLFFTSLNLWWILRISLCSQNYLCIPFSENSQKLATNLSDVIYLLNFVSTRENGLLKTNLHLRFFDFWNFLFKNIGNCSLSSTLSSIIHVSPQSQPFLCIHAVQCYPALVYKLSEKETFLSPWS